MALDIVGGRYRISTILGRGGMAQVWSGIDERLGRPVAIKTLTLDPLDSAAGARFRREASTTAGLSHLNIVTVFDYGVEQSTAFLVMELLTGPSLSGRLTSRGPLSVTETTVVGLAVASALGAAHRAGVIHRDIKPANIGFGGDGVVKVLDFGIARLTNAATGLTQLTEAAAVIGTAAYLSPEQIGGAAVDARTDLYALGCVLYAALTGNPPFAGGTPAEICAQHLHARPEPLREKRPDIPLDLALLVEQLLEKDPESRPATADDVAARLAPIAVPPDASATDTLPSLAWSEPQPASTQLLETLVQPDTALLHVGGTPDRSARARLIAGGIAAIALIGVVILGIRSHAGPDPAARPSTATLSPNVLSPLTSTATTQAVPANLHSTPSAGLATAKPAPTPHGHGHGHGHH